MNLWQIDVCCFGLWNIIVGFVVVRNADKVIVVFVEVGCFIV